VLVARQIGLFELLGERKCSLAEVCKRMKLKPRPAEALLSMAVSLGLARLEGGQYSLTQMAEDYLLESSPTYFGTKLDLDLVILSQGVEALKKAVLTDSPQIYGGGDMFAAHMQQPERARDFTRGMHSVSMGAALKWPDSLDLTKQRMMLDVGGGSGAHSIGATLRWPNLKATIFDIEPVCEVAREFAAAQGLQERIATHVGDMWNDPLPPADIHFYSQIFHDWPPEKCEYLARKSFDSLQPGGRIIIHEILFNDDRIGPFATAAFNLVMLLGYRPAIFWPRAQRNAQGRRIQGCRGQADLWLLEHRHGNKAL